MFAALSICKLNAQQTFSIEQYSDHIVNHRVLPSDVNKIIDENNSFDPFIGIWSGELNGIDYQFYISKTSESDEFYDQFEYLEVRYLISDGAAILSDTRQEDSDEISIFLNYMPNITTSHFKVIDGDDCNSDMTGAFHLVGSPSTGPVLGTVFNEMEVAFQEIPDLFIENRCPNGPTANQFPKDVIFTLTKQ